MAETPEERAQDRMYAANASYLDTAWDVLCEIEAGYPKAECRHTRTDAGSRLWDATVLEVEERRAAGLPDQTRTGERQA